MSEARLPIQQQTNPLPSSFVGAAFGQLEQIQWTHDFDKWWADYGRKYEEHLGAGGSEAEAAERKNKVAQMRKMLLVVWIESRTNYLQTIYGPLEL